MVANAFFRDIRHPVQRWGYLFILPGLVYFGVFIAYPVIWDFVLSLTSTRGIGTLGKPVGLDNYITLLTTDPTFWKSIWHTFEYVLIVVPGVIVFSLLFGFIFETPITGKGVLRVVYFLPAVTSIVAIGVVWKWLYDPTFGLYDQILRIFDVPPLGFLRDRHQVIPSIGIMGIWQLVGYNMIIVQAGLTSIPTEYYEAASLDGVNVWQRTWRITIPLLMPVISYLVTTNLITNLQVFDQVFIMTQGGPGNASTTLAYQMYETAFSFQWFGLGAAIAFLMFVIVLIVTILNFRLLRVQD